MIYLEKFIDASWRRAPLALCLFGISLAFCLSGCSLWKNVFPDKPQKVQNLNVRNLSGTLVVTWKNPIEFDHLKVETEPAGPSIPTDVYPGKGMSTAILENAAPGVSYKVKVLSFTTSVGGMEDETATNPREKTFIGYVDQEDLGRQGKDKEPLDVLYLVHPDLKFSDRQGFLPSSDQSRIFQEVASNVTSEVFRRAVKIQDQSDLEKIEGYRKYLFENRQRLFWLFDPAVLLVIDYRESAESADGVVPGQLYLRIMNLKLATKEGYEAQKKNLFSQRALVSEGYREVNGKFDGTRSMVLQLREAWKALLNDVLEDPRYLKYRSSFTSGAEGSSVTSELELLYFGKVPEQKGSETDDRVIKAIENGLLFGPRPELGTGPEKPADMPAVTPGRSEEAAPKTTLDPAKKPSPRPTKAAPAPAAKKKAVEPKKAEEKEEEKGSP